MWWERAAERDLLNLLIRKTMNDSDSVSSLFGVCIYISRMELSGPPPIFTMELRDSAVKIGEGLAIGCQGILKRF